jgi:hypothetical protein
MLPLAASGSGRVFPRPRRSSCAPLAILLLLVTTSVGRAAPPPKDASAPRPEALWDRKVAGVAAAAQIDVVGNPWTVLAMRSGGVHNLVWSEYEGGGVPALNAELLRSVEDNKQMPDLRNKVLKGIPRETLDEIEVYCQALVNARDTAPELFAKEARDDENRTITYAQLFRQPDLHRGKVIHMAGRLKRIRRENAPQLAQQRGVKYIYEAWVFSETLKSNPVSVLFLHLPEGLPVEESMSQNVSFDGYFFKKYLYRSSDGWRQTLLFVAPTLNIVGPIQAPAEVGSGMPQYVVYAIAGLIAGTIVLVVGLSLLFRHSDQKLRRRLAEVQAARAMDLGFGLEGASGETDTASSEEPIPVEGPVEDIHPAQPNGLAPWRTEGCKPPE